MTTSKDVILVDVIKETIASMQVKVDGVIKPINYQPGRSSQIIQRLTNFDQSYSYTLEKYPLFAMLLPVKVSRGSGYYGNANIERIIIATLTNAENTVLQRYEDGGTFKSILYPCYYEFFRKLALHKAVTNSDPDNFKHTQMDVPGVQPLNTPSRDYIDSIEILNLEIPLLQFKNC